MQSVKAFIALAKYVNLTVQLGIFIVEVVKYAAF